ncbi:hypothetical protein MKZ02_12525 [Pseudobacillus sp. FSL P4-0506]|uniref:hypothetical protein n=1 Tax=Pseudobacillus sp. FSL P4-0506 TaxID=2921576 RepID=UPI0030FC6AAA
MQEKDLNSAYEKTGIKHLNGDEVHSASVVALVNVLAHKGLVTTDEYLKEFTSLIKKMDDKKAR